MLNPTSTPRQVPYRPTFSNTLSHLPPIILTLTLETCHLQIQAPNGQTLSAWGTLVPSAYLSSCLAPSGLGSVSELQVDELSHTFAKHTGMENLLCARLSYRRWNSAPPTNTSVCLEFLLSGSHQKTR